MRIYIFSPLNVLGQKNLSRIEIKERYVTDPEIAKNWFDLFNAIIAFLGLLIAATTAYGILLLTSRPEILLDSINLWPAGKVKGIKSKVLSAQIRFLNPAIGSQITTIFEIDSIEIDLSSNNDHKWHFKPCALLKKLTACEIEGDQQFVPEVEELYHPIIMIGHGQKISHFALVSDENYSLKENKMIIHLKMNYQIYNPLFMPFRNPKRETLERSYIMDIPEEKIESIFVKPLSFTSWQGLEPGTQPGE